jgi:hypothetical protein
MKRIDEHTLTMSFEKDGSDWFAVIPEWEGSYTDLQMVAGADSMCEILAQGEDLVTVDLIVGKIPAGYKVKLVKQMDTPEIGGAVYNVHFSNELFDPFQAWLCDVTRYVFGHLPQEIYIN